MDHELNCDPTRQTNEQFLTSGTVLASSLHKPDDNPNWGRLRISFWENSDEFAFIEAQSR